MLVVLIIFFVLVMIGQASSRQQADIKYGNTYNSLQSLTSDLQTVRKQKAANDTELKQKALHEADLQRQIDDLSKQLQSKRAEQQTIAQKVINTVTLTKPVAAAPASTTVSGCGDNSYANFIYMHESGCSLYNPNRQSGACGLGQADPCSKLMNACPSMDYACENAFFNAYAAKYGGWAGAYAFWQANSWW
jgi:hypothetical protein